jgi:hypothetical protein
MAKLRIPQGSDANEKYRVMENIQKTVAEYRKI